ncbi:MAG: hypothetical protein IKX31_00375 [Muribaculaceae bacterium]|nr:hypothetical protein [Muribaculaceae bacterium]
MKLRLLLIFALISLLGFTANSRQNNKVTNAVNVLFPTMKYRLGDQVKEIGKTTEETYDENYIEDLNIESENLEENYITILAKNATTLLLDTERGTDGTPMRKYIYFYDSYENELTNNGRCVQGVNKVKRLSFPADEAGLAQWRKQLVRLFASKNEQLLAEIETIKEKWSKGKITEEVYNSLIREAINRQAEDLSANRPIVIIKPMGNAETGDVIDAFTIMEKCYITSFQIEDITHTDSVMVFNSLYPGKDMPNDVNFYTYGNLDYPQNFDFTLDVPKGYEDITNAFINPNSDSMRFINDPLYSPVLSIEVAPSKKIKDGASVALTLYEDLFKNDLKSEYVEKNRKRRINRLLASQSFKQLIKRFGNNVAKTEWFELCDNDVSESNDFQKSVRKIEETIIMGGKLEEYALWRNSQLLLIHTDKHTPYSALKCVTDNLRQINLNRMILAY